MPFLPYQEALAWIHSIERFGMNQGLERIEALLGYLGNPHKKLRYLHIGGTNGKGSTAALAASVLQAAGYRTGLYTSPYLNQFTDRMSIDGEEIPEDKLAELVSIVRPLAGRVAKDPLLGQPTQFEIVTAIAFAYFAAARPDIVVLEVGLGGRLDATNVVNPLVTVITTISLEHTGVLGKTVEAIAGEKAGVIKEGTSVVTQAKGNAFAVIEEVCRQKNAPLYQLGKDFSAEYVGGDLEGQTFNYLGLSRNFIGLGIPLLGHYQIDNASVALSALELLGRKGFMLTENAFRFGLSRTRWPGRLEILRREPLVVIDGAHNLEAFQGLRQALPKTFSYKKMILILGILKDKAVEEILKEIIPLADKLIITRPDSPRAADPLHVKKIAAKLTNGQIFVEEEIPAAIKRAFFLASSQDLVLAAGSLYLISEIRNHFIKSGVSF